MYSVSICLSLSWSGEDYEKIVFLFQLERGQAGGSYGLNVAALAGLDSDILRVAGRKSKEMEGTMNLSSSRITEEFLGQPSVQAFKRILELLKSQQYGSEVLTRLRALISD